MTHRRLRPRAHSLGYRIFNMLLDLDEIDRLAGRLRCFSRGTLNVLSFDEADHGDGTATPLRVQIEAMAAKAGVTLAGGAIRILCMPRVFGYVFNPLSVYFCHDRQETLACIVYEVSNTFGQRHSYVIPVDKVLPDFPAVVRQSCAKEFYVSPFLDMDLAYDFEVRPPGEHVSIAVTARDPSGPMIATAFAGRRRPLTDAAILRAVLGHPLLTVKVVAAIHWEALLLWTKGIGLRVRPAAPAKTFTAVASDVD